MPEAVGPDRPARASRTPSDLVRRARDGDEGAFGEIYQLRARAVFGYTRGLLGDSAAAEDATAQTFLQVWSHLPRLRELERFDSWLFRIAHNAAVSETRRRPPASAAMETVPEAADESREADPESLLAGKFDARQVRAAIAQLPEAMREVIALRFFAGLSHEEVARQTGKSAGNVRVIQYRAIERLRDLLADQGYAPA